MQDIQYILDYYSLEYFIQNNNFYKRIWKYSNKLIIYNEEWDEETHNLPFINSLQAYGLDSWRDIIIEYNKNAQI